MDVSVRLLQESELQEADRIFRLAFGTFIKLADPLQFCGDAGYFHHRWKTDPRAAFAAEVDGQLVGSIIAVNWGSFGYFGPLSVHPDFWGQGVAKQLVRAACDRFEAWNNQQTGLFTFPNSPLHHGLYQKFGFWPNYLTMVMGKTVNSHQAVSNEAQFSQLTPSQQQECLQACRELTDSLYPGLDVSGEIQIVSSLNLGDTLLLWDESGLAGFAVCHWGAGTEAGSDTCYVKFGAVRPGRQAGDRFEQLLNLCEAVAATQGLSRLVAGVNSGRQAAYQQMVNRGFRTEVTGVTMLQPHDGGYNRPDIFALDDWR
ncbi:GNAT family N-acetyltransferase [Kamptonema cortianum]|uniref:GNAT family N-acetyltransferase n=1 Tax=Geitlerinema calcuttense NRMC-F 0142 TaxID=2922238 RepID=A0ABT7LWW1_9CYAN|nr:GNAT family N-acetyltransferase [Geitlerinema calcuttense]MDI9640184.1 GNAT family N-acetyltransferase [Geitlerinema splendidum]MDK3158254.1 GNAT family N-acetyltransferase [Kamptonema cortianum]MDL5056514.1 GNAT family N-acetyltransferase [Geitlerinema calcuttense NRMC-F 0142]